MKPRSSFPVIGRRTGRVTKRHPRGDHVGHVGMVYGERVERLVDQQRTGIDGVEQQLRVGDRSEVRPSAYRAMPISQAAWMAINRTAS